MGLRLREAREARSMTAVALADQIEVSRQAVSQYERDQQSPSPKVMERICDALDLPLGYFLDAEDLGEAGVAYFRSLSVATKRARTAAVWRAEWLSRVVRVLESHVVFPPLDLPALPVPDDPISLTGSDLEDIAESVRTAWGLGTGPILNLTWLAEQHGVVVARVDLGDDRLDGLSRWLHDGRPYILVKSSRLSSARLRIDVAHELAHVLLHRKVDEHRHKEGFSDIEIQAFHFASALLYPQAEARKELKGLGSRIGLEDLIQVKERWRISIGAIIMRAAQLGLITDATKKRLFIALSRRGWRKWEPLDSRMSCETPRVLALAAELALTKGSMTVPNLTEETHLPRHEIEKLMGVEAGFLEQHAMQSLELRLRQ